MVYGILVVYDTDLLASLTSKKSIQSCHVEPAKSDIPASNFKNFVRSKYLGQMEQFYDKFDDESLKIPDGWVWTPDNVNEGQANDKYMQMPVILMAVQCLHAKYASTLKFNVCTRLINVLCSQMYNDNEDIIYTKPVTARLIKYMVYNHGAGNVGKVTVGDYGFVKPYWTDPVSKQKFQYNQYCRVRGVKL